VKPPPNNEQAKRCGYNGEEVAGDEEIKGDNGPSIVPKKGAHRREITPDS
jgi:hypothetical protein